MREKKLSLGMFAGRSMMLSGMAAAGFNHVVFDHMFSPLDWGATQTACLTARHYGLAPLVRVQTYPWSPEPGGDMGAISMVGRVRMIGAAGAIVSFGSVAQLKAVLRVATDTEHIGVVGPRAVEAFRQSGEEGLWALVPEDLRAFPIVAYIEKLDLMDNLEEIVELEGLQAIGFGIHDVCYAVGAPYDVEHPEVWKVLDRGVSLARQAGLSVWTNTGYIYTREEETVDRIARMYDRGIDAIQVQSPEQFAQRIMTDIVEGAFRRVKS
jgi:2-keto-3-deoxy-L-rhamnonate aldolase RhmA